MQVYLVGGAVRDRLLGRAVGERDWVVVGATPAELTAQGYAAVGKDFPVFLHPQTKEKPGWTPLKDIKTLKDDAAAVEQQGSAIRQRYTRIFRV